ncbi:ETC complex I subunit conserved region-domain-containing protein [Pilaira anomala]|nr:ETC complex I subunit conserved region-domain-containing protein [Pilaira anomala]
MTSPLVARTALLCRSAFAKPALFNTVRFSSSSSSEKNDVIVLENEPILSVENLSGAPDHLLERGVRIFRPTRTPTQQGKNGTRLWRIDFDILEDGNRWENPLMGWASRKFLTFSFFFSSDYEQALTMKFLSKEDAVRFAEKQGWNYYVQEPQTPKIVKKSYAENFLYSPKKLRLIMTK